MSRKKLLVLVLGILMVVSVSLILAEYDWKRIYVRVDEPDTFGFKDYVVHKGSGCPYEMDAERHPAKGQEKGSAHYEFSCYNAGLGYFWNRIVYWSEGDPQYRTGITTYQAADDDYTAEIAITGGYKWAWGAVWVLQHPSK